MCNLNFFDFYHGCMKKLDKRIIDAQIEVFCSWGRRHNNAKIGGHLFDRPWLELFALKSSKTDILDVDDTDVERFLRDNKEDMPYEHQRERAFKAITQMRRFYAARNKNGRNRGVNGRPPNISEIARVQDYRKKGLKLREIEVLTGKKISWIHRAINYPLDLIKGVGE